MRAPLTGGLVLLLALSGCGVLQQAMSPPPTASAPLTAASQPSAALPDRLPVTVTGETLAWNGNTRSYDRLTGISREAELFTVRLAGGRLAFAVRSGLVGSGSAGSILFATNTAALRDVPGMKAGLADSAITVVDLSDTGGGRYDGTVNSATVRTVTVLGFEVTDTDGPKQLLDGTVELQVDGSSVSGTLDLGGGDYVGGVQVNNRYRATITGR